MEFRWPIRGAWLMSALCGALLSLAGPLRAATFPDRHPGLGREFGVPQVPSSTSGMFLASPLDDPGAEAGAVYLRIHRKLHTPTQRPKARRAPARAAGVAAHPERPGHVDPHPAPDSKFGVTVVRLSTGNAFVLSPVGDAAGTDADAVYLRLNRSLRAPAAGRKATGPSARETAVAAYPPPFPEFVDPNPTPGNGFGSSVVALSTGNVVITSPFDDAGGVDAGAVYLFNGSTGALISTLTSSTAGDYTDSFVTALSNGNYVIVSPNWNGTTGAVTWGSGTTGVSGVVSAANSLVGSTANDGVGVFGVTALSNGNYVVASPYWNGNTGAATWGDGTAGVSGPVSAANSLVGTTAGDYVASHGVTALSNGNYVVTSEAWNSAMGAVTWGNGNTGVSGAVSDANSLVGSTAGDQVGVYGVHGVTALSNGNYVVVSLAWHGNRGATTWGDGTTGVTGIVSDVNSLVGSIAGDYVGFNGVTALWNGNYVVNSPRWNGTAGAVTWGDGTTGVTGIVSDANSLVGSTAGDLVGDDLVTALSNGNYVVDSRNWNSARGAATWGDGTTGVKGPVSAANSLVGSTANDNVGSGGVSALWNGNYIVNSAGWNSGTGAATWGSGTTGVSGAVSAANSLVGSTAGDQVGYSGVIGLANGNYVVSSPNWNSGMGAATWGDGTTGVTGVVSTANSLVGSSGVTALWNGNYVVSNVDWNSARGAATWGDGTTGVSGVVSVSNSLVGSTAGDDVGLNGVYALSNGNYVVSSPNWNSARGAATWGDGTAGVTGRVSTANSLVGSTAGDQVSADYVMELTNGNYVVASPNWNSDRGAATWGDGTAGVTGRVSTANSLVGSTTGDQVGVSSFTCVTALTNGNYVVASPNWTSARGAATLGNGTTGVKGPVSAANSLVGTTPNTHLRTVVVDNVNGTFIAPFVDEANGRARVGSQSAPPKIVIVYPGGSYVPNGGSADLLGVAVGQSSSWTFTITNIGDADLTGLGTTIDGPDAAEFGVTAAPTVPVAGPSGSTTFTLTFTPLSPGIKTAALHIASNSPADSPFTINLTNRGAVGVGSDAAVAFALEGARPNPATASGLDVAFALPTGAAAHLELLDVAGRRVVAREVGTLGAGRHTVNLAEARKVAPGIYWVRLTQGANRRTARVAVIE